MLPRIPSSFSSPAIRLASPLMSPGPEDHLRASRCNPIGNSCVSLSVVLWPFSFGDSTYFFRSPEKKRAKAEKFLIKYQLTGQSYCRLQFIYFFSFAFWVQIFTLLLKDTTKFVIGLFLMYRRRYTHAR